MRTIADMLALSCRVTVVTDGGNYIGWAVAETLAELGIDVAIWDLQTEYRQKDALTLADRYGVSVRCVQVNIEDEIEVGKAAQATQESFGRLDILVHTAAQVGTSLLLDWTTSFEDKSIENWRWALDVNLPTLLS